MDITTVFGTVIPGSNPGGSTKNISVAQIFCAPAARRLRVVRQVISKSRREALRKSGTCFCSNRNGEERLISKSCREAKAGFSHDGEKRLEGEIPGRIRYTWHER
jgi:hypothetical protein